MTILKRTKPCTYCGQLDCVKYAWPHDQRDNAASLVSRNPDPEAKIEQMIHELAYERVKNSYLFNQFGNALADKKADELAEEITELIENWISREVNAAA